MARHLLCACQDAAQDPSVRAIVLSGAGVSLVLNADFVIASEGTRFNLAYINIGASCDGGASFALPRIVGLRHALEIAMLGEAFDACTATHDFSEGVQAFFAKRAARYRGC